MTYHPSHSTEHLPPPEAQAEEAIHWGKVLGVGVGSLIVFAIAILVVLRMLHAREKALQPMGPDPLPMQLGQMSGVWCTLQTRRSCSRGVDGLAPKTPSVSAREVMGMSVHTEAASV